jgi:hypothetical protein
VGERQARFADQLLRNVAQRVRGIPDFFSDGLRYYRKAILRSYGLKVSFLPTGLRGRPRKPALLPPSELRYAQVVKHHRGGRLVCVERRQVFGKFESDAEISTTFIERNNLTMRQENHRLARKTLGFSKKRSGLDDQMTLFYAHFNFCRPHGSLKHKDENGIKRKWTPLRELGITDRNWSLLELLTFPYHKISV